MRHPRWRVPGALVSVVAVAVACAAGASAGGRSSTAMSPLVAKLPPQLRAFYDSTTDPIKASLYKTFTAKPKPWRFCFADSYEGNDWRLDVRKELDRLAKQFKGQVSGLDVAVSNGDVALQNSQIRSFVDKGCNLILSIPASATGINAAIGYSFSKNVPFVAFAGAVTSPYAINVDSNYFIWGRDMAQAVAKALGGKGNVVMVKGIEGQPVAVAENKGAESAWKKYPGINVIARVNGNWTPSVTKSVMLQTLSTHPQSIDAVWTTGSEMRFVAQTFQQAGKRVPLITGSPTGDSLAYAKANHGTRLLGGAVLPTWTADTAFRVGVRLLLGQHPKLNTLMVPIPPFSSQQLSQWFRPCMAESSVTPFPVSPTDPLPEALMNGYFTNGKATPPYSYKSVPSPCK